ncbi:hypothetical protein BDR06DRAFT_878184, partial [Suillus hirtellus]
LNLTHSEANDHINHGMWLGNIISGNCDLQSTWRQGQDDTLQLLQTTQMPASTYDFHSYFFLGSGINLMCVFGGGKYLSVDNADDDEDQLLALLTPSAVEPAGKSSKQVSTSHDEDREDELAASFEDLLEETLEPEDLKLTTANTDSNTESSPTAPLISPGICLMDYIWYEKKWIHKQSICCLVITPNFIAKSQSQLLHVCGFSPVNKHLNDVEVGHILHGDNFLTGDLFLTLVRTHNKLLTLALVQATTILENGTSHARIKTTTLQSQCRNVKVTGEIMVLVPSHRFDSDATWV